MYAVAKPKSISLSLSCAGDAKTQFSNLGGHTEAVSGHLTVVSVDNLNPFHVRLGSLMSRCTMPMLWM